MKAKTSAALFAAFVFVATQFSLLGQPTDCYNIVCPSKIFAPCEGVYGAHAWFSVAATNTCDPTLAPIPVTYSAAPGSIFPPGTNIVCAVIQIPGLPARKCCFEVIVDNCCPTNCIDIICPSNIVVACQQTAGAQPGAQVALPKPVVTNYCGDHVLPATLALRCTPPTSTSGGATFFPPGTNTVVCCLTDGNRYLNCCCFQVIVKDCPQPTPNQCQPQITCPSVVEVQCQGPDGGIAFFPAPKITDPCNLVIGTNITAVSGSFFPNGKTTVAACIAYRDPSTGAILTECCCFDVVVRCCPPTNCVSRLDCPNNIVLDCPPTTANGIVLNYKVFGTNNCEPTTLSCNPPPGTIINGPVTVCCKLLSSGGNVLTQCCFNVTINDTVAPMINCPGDISVVSSNCQPVAVALPVVTATDNCDPHPTVTCTGADATGLFPCGVTTITCTAVDFNGNSSKCSFNVTVICDSRPRITCPPDLVLRCVSPTGVVVTYTATATNPCSATVPAVVCDPPSGSVFLPGSWQVCCKVVDAVGAAPITCCFKVTVEADDVPPTIICPTNMLVLTANCGPVAVEYLPPTASDNCQLASVKCNPPSGSMFPLGTTTVTCCAADKAGNTNCCSFTVSVRCPTNCIQVVCPSNIVVECTSPNGAPVKFDAYATNVCNGAQEPLVCTPPSGSVFPPGTTVVCCTNAPSANGVQFSCCFKVTVICQTDCFHVVCPSNITVNCAGPNGALITFNAYGTNSCTGAVTPLACSQASGTFFPPGVTTVCCTNAVAGAVPQWCCFDVIVRPYTKPPVINCSSNIYILCGQPRGAKVEYVVTASDDCDTAVNLTCVPPSGSLFRLGCTNVTCVAVDNAGNASTCTFRVCVLRQGCYLTNPSFELVAANVPPPAVCGDPIADAIGWSALSGTPDLFRPPTGVPVNCRGQEKPCQGTNYAGLEGGYTSSGGFTTEEMMGTLIVPLNNNKQFRLRACLSLAESSTGPVLVEFVLANSANLAQQQVIHQVWVTQKIGWQQYMPPCFLVPDFGHWDRLIIRMAKVSPLTHTYPLGYVYVDNVNICCCKPNITHIDVGTTTVTVTWDGGGQLQGCAAFGDPAGWHDITSPVEIDPETGESKTTLPLTPDNSLFRLLGPDAPVDCAECGSGG